MLKSSSWMLPVIFVSAIVSLWYQQQGDILLYYTNNDITFTTTTNAAAGNNKRRTAAEEVQQQRHQGQPSQKQAPPSSKKKLRRDEFIQKKLSTEEINQYFYFDVDRMNEKLLARQQQQEETAPLLLQPLGGRKCFPTTTMGANNNNNNYTNSSIISRELELHHTNNNDNKLVFLHVWRSAGATIRALLRAYSYYCQNGFATVTKCIDLGSEYMYDNKDVWASGKASQKVRHDCVLRSALDRQRQIINKTKVSKSFLQKYNIDILAGHIPLGCGEVWKQQQPQQMPKVQYVVFLRDPVYQFVSSLLFAYKSRIAARRAAAGDYPDSNNNDILTIDDGYNIINSTVHNMTHDNIYYLQTTNQLITPDQESYVYNENIQWTYERRVNLTLSNLMNYNVVVGIVERMPESIQMLQYVLVDGGDSGGGGTDNEITGLFNYFATAVTASSNNTSNRLISNYMQTKNQTDMIVNNLVRQDPELMSMLNERLKYEKQIYEWGLRIHKRQYESIISTKQ